MTHVEVMEWVADRDAALKAKDAQRAEAILLLLAKVGIKVETRSDNSTHICGQS
jgi:hypothetical protein